MILQVFVPKSGSLLARIKRGSGIVGQTLRNGMIHIYYEGAIYNQSGMGGWVDKISYAAGRSINRYPTIAAAVARPEELSAVGVYDTDAGQVTITDEKTVMDWLGGAILASDLQRNKL